MGRRIRAHAALALLGALVSVSACKRDSASKTDHGFPAPSASGLDGMQFSSARRVALESAKAAMQRRDLERLKQLNVWVRNRAQVALFEPDDLSALELAIQCLEQVTPASTAVASLDDLRSGSLRQPARVVCLEHAAP